MNHKLIISRVVLSSALLMSAVAGPAISNAATKAPTPEKIQTFNKVILKDSVGSTNTISVVNSFTNPLDLAKKYAPDTLADWKKTLDQYEKTIGSSVVMVSSSIEATPVASITEGNISVTTSTTNKTSVKGQELSLNTAPVIDLKSNSNVQMVKAVATEASSSDMSFIRAEIELAKAVQDEDAAAIKQSLAKLLVQYKEQIAAWETAK